MEQRRSWRHDLSIQRYNCQRLYRVSLIDVDEQVAGVVVDDVVLAELISSCAIEDTLDPLCDIINTADKDGNDLDVI
jgi:hypothetical protein